ncbi:hypothetical protein VBD025_16585 [Virgibacillus flavescens]|uniref:hypothetical protein n=1 Tax=Virgibacillus flavescens TaxID=1611422 RepID=UPI003D32C359
MQNNDKKSSENNNDHIEKQNKLDKDKEQLFVDDIPMEDLKIEQDDEKKKSKSKDASQSERKYNKNDK